MITQRFDNLLLAALFCVMLVCTARGQVVDPEPPPTVPVPSTVQVWLTTYDASKKLARQADLAWSTSQPAATFNAVVDETQQFQQIDGFGASITDDAIWKADPAVRDEIMRLLFSRSSGIGMNMIRVPMRTESASGAEMTYDDMPRGQTDPTLANFSIAGDLDWKVPMMQRAKELNPELTLMGTPWSAPYWMKDSGAMGYGRLLSQYYGAYANYFVKWIQAWRDNGLGISAVTMQNEPHFEPYSYQGMRMDATDQIAFALQLGPAVRSAGFSTRIICWDHNFDEYTYPITVLDDPDARQWIDGSAFHAYAGDPNNMGFVKTAHPDKNLYFTEQTGSYPGDGFGGSLQWHVKNLFMIPGWNYSRCTLLWQLALSSTTLSGDRPFVRVAADGKSYELFGEYYETGHFSKFIRKGAYRIYSDTSPDGMPRTIAYQNPDGSKVLVVLNDGSSAITVSIQDNGRWVSYPMAGGSLASFIWRDVATGNGLAATYYDNPDLTGITESRIDPTVDFNWAATGTPDPAIGYAGFSARWTGKVMPQNSELYTFYTTTSDGVRLWVNNQLVVDNWVNQGATETSGTIPLTANQATDIRMEYYCVSGSGVANLAWSSPSMARQTIPRSQLYAPATSTVPPPPTRLYARCTNSSIGLSWSAAPTATSHTLKRSTTKGGPYTGLATTGTATTYTDSAVTAGTTYYYVVSGSNAIGAGTHSAPSSSTPPTALPAPWSHQDIGSVGITGNSGSVGSQLMIASAGNDIWNSADSCHFTYLPMTGDGTIIARVASQEKTATWTKSGVMMRETLAANSAEVTVAVTPMQGIQLASRVTTAAATTGTMVSGPFPPAWLKLVRSGTNFTGYYSPDGNRWSQVGSPVGSVMAATIYVGLAVSSNNSSALNISTFDSISAPGLPTPVPLAPEGVIATAGNASAGLVWNDVAYATSYNIKRATVSGGPYTTVGSTSSTTYTDGTALNGTACYYVITGVNQSGESTSSAEVSATPSQLLLPKGWIDQDIGTLGFAGGATYTSGTFSIKGSGSDIWGTSDGFNYCYQTVSGDGVIIARVNSVQNTSTYAKAALMFRDSTQSNSVQVSIQVNPGGSVDLTYRTASGASTADSGWTGSGLPKWVKLVRNGTNFSGYYSSNGSTWTQLGTTVSVPLSNDVLVGMAVSAANNAALNTSVFDNVGITGFGAPVTPSGLTATQLLGGIHLIWNTASQATGYNVKRATTSGGPYITIATTSTNSFLDLTVSHRTTYYYVVSALNAVGESGNSGEAGATSNTMPIPTGWTDQNIGSVGYAGNADYANGGFTVRGSGADIWNNSDAFNYCYKAVSTTGTISARVVDVQNTNTSAKAGVMFRESMAAGSRYALICVTPSAGIKFEYRSSTNGTAKSKATTSGTAPVYLRLVRGSSNSFSAYYSSNGSTWTQLGTAQTINMASSAYQGLAVTALDNSALNTSTFDNITAFNYQVPGTPTGVTATAGNGQTALTWTAVSGAAGYYVKRGTSPGGPYATMANPTGTAYTDAQAFNGTAYYYVVSALTSSAEGANSSEVRATPRAPIAPVPAGLTAASGDAQIALTWAASSGAVTYNVKRASNSGGPYTTVASPATASYTDTNLNRSTAYYYVVSAVNSGGESTNSSEVSATTFAQVPSGLTATSGSSQVALSWTASPGATSYNVKRATTNGGPYNTVFSPATASYTDTGLTNAATYYYVVSAVNGGGESADSTQVSATPQPPIPATPTGVVAISGSAQVTVNWTASGGATTYYVKRSTNNGGPYTTVASPATSSYTDTGLTNGTIYYYVVSAVNTGGESVDSTQVSATPQPPGSAIWIGPDNGNWNVAGSWSGSAPTDSSTGNLIFNQTTNRTSVNNLNNLMIASLAISGGAGTNTITGNQLLLSGSITVSSTMYQVIATPMALSGNQTVNVATGGRLTLSGNVQNGGSAGAFTKAGSGTLVISGSNSFTGVGVNNLTLASGGGTVIVADPNALGSTASGSHFVVMSGGATLDLQTDASFAGFGLNMGSTATATTVMVSRKTAGPGVAHSLAVLNVGSTIWNFVTGTNVTSGTAGISFTTLQMTAGNNDRPVTLGGDARISIGNASITSTGIAKRLQLDGSNRGNVITGVISDGIAGAVVNLIKANSSTWTLFGSNSFTGSTTVTGGTLVMKQACLNDTAQLAISGSGVLQLDHGMADLVGSLVLGGTAMPNGSYDASTGGGRITGTGRIQVGPLPAPASLTSTTGNARVSLNWTASSGAMSYNVKRASASGGPYATLVSGITDTSYTDPAFGPNGSLTAGALYYYTVSAVNNLGESVDAARVVAMPVPPATQVMQNGNSLSLVLQSASGATYQLQRKGDLNEAVWTNEGSPVAGSGQTITLTHTNGLQSARQFYRCQIVLPP